MPVTGFPAVSRKSHKTDSEECDCGQAEQDDEGVIHEFIAPFAV
jgi:hypothetical protein